MFWIRLRHLFEMYQEAYPRFFDGLRDFLNGLLG